MCVGGGARVGGRSPVPSIQGDLTLRESGVLRIVKSDFIL